MRSGKHRFAIKGQWIFWGLSLFIHGGAWGMMTGLLWQQPEQEPLVIDLSRPALTLTGGMETETASASPQPAAKPSGFHRPAASPDKIAKVKTSPPIHKPADLAIPPARSEPEASPLDTSDTDKSASNSPAVASRELRQPERAAYTESSGQELRYAVNDTNPSGYAYQERGFSGGSGPAARKNLIAMPGLKSADGEEETGDLLRYKQTIKGKIEALKEYPWQARRDGLEGTVKVKFLIQRDGQIKAVEMLNSSTFSILDQAAIRAIKSAAPFLPLPQDVGRDEIWFKLAIGFKLS